MVDIDKPLEVNIATEIVYRVFRIQEMMTFIKNYNYPQIEDKVIFAMWHANQCCLHGIPYEKRKKVHVLISRSGDGEVIARVVQKWGFSTVRGSKDVGERKKGGVRAAMGMIDILNNGDNVAIMVDGPAGPYHEIKNGVVKVAKHTGAAVIPMTWYSPSPTLLKLPSWDKFEIPIGPTPLVNLYGEPLYLKEDATKEEDNRFKEQLKQALLELEKKAPEAYKEVHGKRRINNEK